MAKAKLIEQVDEKPFCTLELTQIEAEMIRAAFGVIEGSGHKRRAVDAVWNELGRIGLKTRGSDTFMGDLKIKD